MQIHFKTHLKEHSQQFVLKNPLVEIMHNAFNPKLIFFSIKTYHFIEIRIFTHYLKIFYVHLPKFQKK